VRYDKVISASHENHHLFIVPLIFSLNFFFESGAFLLFPTIRDWGNLPQIQKKLETQNKRYKEMKKMVPWFNKNN
jgi:hypothetical protein